MSWAVLALAIVLEVSTTLTLRVAVHGPAGRTRAIRYAVVILGYLLAFGLLSWALHRGLPIGIAYGVWAAAGVGLTALAAHWLFRDPLTRTMVAGIALIAAGVLLVESGH